MKIAVNTRVLLKDRMEGVCRYIHETTKRMVLAHPEDEFYFLFDRPFHPSFIYADNVIPLIVPPPTRDPILWKIWFDFSVPRILNKYNIDVFLSGDTYASLNTNVPTVLVTHDLAYLHYPEHLPGRVLNYYQKYFPLFHQKAAEIIAVSEFTKNDIVNSYGIKKEKISIAYNAAPKGFAVESEIEKLNIRKNYSDGQPFFIYVGSIHPRKNIANLIFAFEKFKEKNHSHKLILIGRKAWKYKEIEELIRISKFNSDIIYLDGNTHEPKLILPAADALCYLSLHEGFGIPLLEAMSCNVPVICSNTTSLPEVAGNAALTVNPKKPIEIAEAMHKIISNADLRENLIKNGRKRVQSFKWEESAITIYNCVKKANKINQN